MAQASRAAGRMSRPGRMSFTGPIPILGDMRKSLSSLGRTESILVGPDDLATGPRADGPPRRCADAILDELDRAVAEQDVDPAGVVAAGDVRDLEPGAAAPGVGRHDVDVARIRRLAGHPGRARDVIVL